MYTPLIVIKDENCNRVAIRVDDIIQIVEKESNRCNIILLEADNIESLDSFGYVCDLWRKALVSNRIEEEERLDREIRLREELDDLINE